MTPQQVKQNFNQNGVTFSDWAKSRGFDRNKVYMVLNGANKGKRGEGHRIAVALGIKQPTN